MRSRKQAIMEAVIRVMQEQSGGVWMPVERLADFEAWPNPLEAHARKIRNFSAEPYYRDEKDQAKEVKLSDAQAEKILRFGQKLGNVGASLRAGQITDPIRDAAYDMQDKKEWEQSLNRMSGKGNVYSPVTKNPLTGEWIGKPRR